MTVPEQGSTTLPGRARGGGPRRSLRPGRLDLLPRGHALPREVWEVRHRWVTSILAACTALLPLFALVRGFPAGHALLEALGPALLVALACAPRLGHRARSSVSAVGTMLFASLVVHLSQGAIEAHFLFFVMVPVVALYESWVPFGLAVGYVLFQHGVIGTLHSSAVYDHAGAQESPWLWAAVHAGLFAASCLASMVSWRLHEQARAAGEELERARAAVAQQARTDPLTGLRNRLELAADLEQLQALSDRHGRSFCVALCDIDFFKAYNDTYGHLLGDQALHAVAATLTEQLRSTDRVYRYGGEEFLVLLRDKDVEEAAAALQRVHRALRDLAVEHRGAGPGAVLTLSAGLACSRPGRRPTSFELLDAADRALYAAKADGRNRTALSPVGGGPLETVPPPRSELAHVAQQRPGGQSGADRGTHRDAERQRQEQPAEQHPHHDHDSSFRPSSTCRCRT